MGSRTRTRSQLATMVDAVTAGAAPLFPGLPDEIIVWEILIRLPPKPLLRCRAVCRAWRRTTTTRDFLLAHHGRQPSLPVVCGYGKASEKYINIIAFDHRAADAQLQPVARLDDAKSFWLQASCDGLVILCRDTSFSRHFSVCNPATREHALLRPSASSNFIVMGMYLHRPSGEYRLLLYQIVDKHGCHVFALQSNQPARYIEAPETASAVRFKTPALVRDSLHWPPAESHIESKMVIVFDTTAESFRQMRAPVPAVPPNSCIFEMDGTLGIYNYNEFKKVVDIWVLQNYEGEVWEYKYQVELPVAEITGQCGRMESSWHASIVSVHADGLLLLTHHQSLFYVNLDGKMVDSFHHDDPDLSFSRFQLKQTLVPHTFFTALEDYAVNAWPFI